MTGAFFTGLAMGFLAAVFFTGFLATSFFTGFLAGAFLALAGAFFAAGLFFEAVLTGCFFALALDAIKIFHLWLHSAGPSQHG